MRYIIVATVLVSIAAVSCKNRAYNQGSATKDISAQRADWDTEKFVPVNASEVEFAPLGFQFAETFKKDSSWKTGTMDGKIVYSIQLNKSGTSSLRCERNDERSPVTCKLKFSQSSPTATKGEPCKAYREEETSQTKEMKYCKDSIKAFDSTGQKLRISRVEFTGEEALTLYNSLTFNVHGASSGMMRPGEPTPVMMETHGNDWIACGNLDGNENDRKMIICRVPAYSSIDDY
jgi:hypothetical protein